MSFFDNMKKSLGIKSSPFSGVGQVLGRSGASSQGAGYFTGYTNEETADYMVFEMIFVQDKMGMSINECKEMLPIDGNNRAADFSRAVVSGVKANSEAESLGVVVGDIIVSLNKHQLTNFEDFYNFIVALGRPMTIQFYRPYKRIPAAPAAVPAAPSVAASSGAVASSSGSAPNTAGSTINNITNTLLRPFSATSRQQSSNANTSNSASNAISEEEKAARRDAASKAAAERLDKRVGSSKAKSQSAARVIQEDTSPPPVNEEAQRMIQKVKDEEARVASQLGYSPFKPHMSFSGNGVSTVSSNASNNVNHVNQGVFPPAPPATQAINSINLIPPAAPIAPIVYGPTPAPQPALTPEEEEELLVMTSEVDDAFAMIISLGDSEQERAKVAVQTVQKMLLNLQTNKQDMKFRSIRLSNKAFHSKVGCISGGVELLMAAGYHYQATGAEGVSIVDSISSDQLDHLVSTLASTSMYNENVEEYLVHDMDGLAERKLKYTISRLNDIMEMQRNLV